jgi:hypothetical protein
MKKFKGHQGCTHRVVSEPRDGQHGRYDDQKKKEKKKKERKAVTELPEGLAT